MASNYFTNPSHSPLNPQAKPTSPIKTSPVKYLPRYGEDFPEYLPDENERNRTKAAFSQ